MTALAHFAVMLAEVDALGFSGIVGVLLFMVGIVLVVLLIFLPLFVAGIYSQIQLTNRLLKQLIKLYGHDPEK